MKRLLLPVTAAVLLAALSGCANLQTLTRARQIDHEIRMDRLRFAQEMSDQWFLVGYEYHKMAKKAEELGDEALQQEYQTRASICELHYKNLRRLAQELRADMQAEMNVSPTAQAGPAAVSETFAP